MREIKFRAWDGHLKKMYAQNNHITFHFSAKRDWTCWHLLGHKTQNCVASCNGHKDHLMQYTGLKDKNGVEIYEGDVIKTDYGVIIPIRFKNGVFEGFLNKDGSVDFLHVDFIDIDYGLECEVIGNIHQNPELLT